MIPAPLIFWFRQDLRLADHAGLSAALASGQPVLPLYILDETPELRRMGGASLWWLHHSLTALGRTLPLRLRRGVAEQVLQDVIKETGATGVYWSRCYEPEVIARDTRLKEQLRSAGYRAESFNSALLFEPWAIKNKSGNPFQVFTPYWRHCVGTNTIEACLPAPANTRWASARSDTLDDWQLLPTNPDWATGFCGWNPGEAGALTALDAFLNETVAGYKDARNLPARRATSRLSPHLHFGEISPRQIWHATHFAQTGPQHDRDCFLSEIGWREFSYHLLYHYPALPHTPLNKKFASFPWAGNTTDLAAWQRGQTGYPIVDAGMRELWQTGWMHNRVRMIVASFLIKDLLLPWQQGETWFWDTLVDADMASNAASWQWVAGCGADAAPYFRVFNPVLQGEKFDPTGDYIRRYVPEIAQLPNKWVHKPFAAPPDLLVKTGITLGVNYPHPLVNHSLARDRALAAFAEIKNG